MNAMGSSDNHGCLEFMSAFLQYIEESPKIFQNDCGCIGHLQRHSGIEDIGGREAEMKISRSRAHELRDRSRESDHIVLHLGLDLINTIDRERGARFDFRCGVSGNDSLIGECFRYGQLDVQPSVIFVLVFPDLAHPRARVTRDHNLPL